MGKEINWLTIEEAIEIATPSQVKVLEHLKTWRFDADPLNSTKVKVSRIGRKFVVSVVNNKMFFGGSAILTIGPCGAVDGKARSMFGQEDHSFDQSNLSLAEAYLSVGKHRV